jgi:hypothetical protein
LTLVGLSAMKEELAAKKNRDLPTPVSDEEEEVDDDLDEENNSDADSHNTRPELLPPLDRGNLSPREFSKLEQEAVDAIIIYPFRVNTYPALESTERRWATKEDVKLSSSQIDTPLLTWKSVKSSAPNLGAGVFAILWSVVPNSRFKTLRSTRLRPRQALRNLTLIWKIL